MDGRFWTALFVSFENGADDGLNSDPGWIAEINPQKQATASSAMAVRIERP